MNETTMKSELIDCKSGKIFTPTKEIYSPHFASKNLTPEHTPTFNRRSFLLYSLASSAGLLALNNKSNAAFFVALGYLVAGSIIRGVARAIGTTVARRVVGIGATGYTSLPKRVQAAVVEEVVTDLAELGIKEASKKVIHQIATDEAKALWAKDDLTNPLSLKIENNTSDRVETPIKLALKAESNKKPEVIKEVIIKMAPHGNVEFEIDTFIDLPHEGLKYVASGIPASFDKKITINSTENISVMRTTDIYS